MSAKDAEILKNIAAHRVGELAAKFYDDVQTGPKCWEWVGIKDSRGYGQFIWGGHNFIASRMAYFLAFGPLP